LSYNRHRKKKEEGKCKRVDKVDSTLVATKFKKKEERKI